MHRQLLALDELQPRLVEDARDAELVGVGGSGLGRRGGREVQARADTAVERERERLAPGAGLFEVELQVSAGVDVDVQGLLVDDHEALDRRVAHPGLGVAGDDHAGVEVRAAVLERMHRRRDAPEVDLDGLPFVDRAVPDHHRGGRPALPLLDAPGDELGEGVLVALHQVREQLPRPVQAGQHRRVVSLDVLEEHRAGAALEAGRDRRELQVGLHLRSHLDQAAHRVEVLDDGCEIAEPVSRHDVASAGVARQCSRQVRRIVKAPAGNGRVRCPGAPVRRTPMDSRLRGNDGRERFGLRRADYHAAPSREWRASAIAVIPAKAGIHGLCSRPCHPTS